MEDSFTASPRLAREKICARCGVKFLCGPAPGKEDCWCDALPAVGPLAGTAHDCLCPDCLRAAIAAIRSALS